MARPPRIDYPGAIHHVMNRGSNHDDIFVNDLDRQLLAKIWREAAQRFGIEIICFCWMNNHFHVLLRCPDAQLSETMQFVGRSYTQQYNHHHGRDGALYRGRFNSVLVDEQAHFDHVTRYIHLNPVKANLWPLDALDTYTWSTYSSYVGTTSTPDWIAASQGLASFSSPQDYRSFVEAGPGNPLVERFYARPFATGRVLGNQQFVDRIRGLLDDETASRVVAGIPEYSINEVDEAVARVAGRPLAEMRQPSRSNPARNAAILLASELADATIDELLGHYEFPSRTAVTSAVSHLRTTDSQQFTKLYNEAKRSLSDIQGLTPDVR